MLYIFTSLYRKKSIKYILYTREIIFVHIQHLNSYTEKYYNCYYRNFLEQILRSESLNACLYPIESETVQSPKININN